MLNVKAVVAFNQEKALVGAFSVIVKYSANIRLKLYLLPYTALRMCRLVVARSLVTPMPDTDAAPATTRPFLIEAEYDRSNNKLLSLCHTQPLDTSTPSRVDICW